jgi:DNA invertase Pin-like site-specific DNA recombinase
MAKNRGRRRKSYKNKDVTALIKIINRLHKKQDKLLQRIEDLEEYSDFFESVYMPEEDSDDPLMAGTFIEFEADDVFEEILQDQLTDTQKDKVEEIKKGKKKKKEKKPKLYSIDEILDTLDEKKDK